MLIIPRAPFQGEHELQVTRGPQAQVLQAAQARHPRRFKQGHVGGDAQRDRAWQEGAVPGVLGEFRVGCRVLGTQPHRASSGTLAFWLDSSGAGSQV